jgi:hypothetical protein
MRIPAPFHLPRHMQFACEQRFERELQHFMRQTFTVGTNAIDNEEPTCLLDLIPAPSCNFSKGMDFLEWAQKTLRTLHFLLGFLLRLSSCAGGKKLFLRNESAAETSAPVEEPAEIRAAKLWYSQFVKLQNAEAYRTRLRVQIERYILCFPGLVVDHVSLFPNLCFEDKLELVCSLCFSACKIFLRPFWNPHAVPTCPDATPSAMARFHASWQQPLYRKVLSKAEEGSFSVRILDAYQKPVARLMDHYNYYELLLSTSFPI